MSSGSLHLHDGRLLETWISGPEDGLPFVFHHGTPGTARPRRGLERAVHAHGLRFVGFSRPGYAGSTRRPGRSIADVVDDTRAVLASIGATECLVGGQSGGGPHVLATIARLPEAQAALSIASLAPFDVLAFDYFSGMGEDNVEEFGAALAGEADLRHYLEARRPRLLTADAAGLTETMSRLLPRADAAVVTGEYGEDSVRTFHDALGDSVDGWLDDDLAFARDWEFSLDEIRKPVLLWQGQEDLMVPYAHGEWLAAHVPGVTAHLQPGEGHLSLAVGAIDRMLDELIAAA